MINTGKIEIICGGMFSGKTEELIRRIKRILIARQKIQVFKPQIDNRFSPEHIVSHNNDKILALQAAYADNILELLDYNVDVVAIDEAQFFDKRIINVCENLADKGIRVIIAGLDLDYSGKPFGYMPELLARADSITKLNAICSKCGENACRSALLINGKPAGLRTSNVLIGAGEKGYMPLCRHCYNAIIQDSTDLKEIQH